MIVYLAWHHRLLHNFISGLKDGDLPQMFFWEQQLSSSSSKAAHSRVSAIAPSLNYRLSFFGMENKSAGTSKTKGGQDRLQSVPSLVPGPDFSTFERVSRPVRFLLVTPPPDPVFSCSNGPTLGKLEVSELGGARVTPPEDAAFWLEPSLLSVAGSDLLLASLHSHIWVP